MSFENALGAQPPLGFFDPLGLLKNADQARFDRLREVSAIITTTIKNDVINQ